MSTGTIAVYGATGFTGRLTAECLSRRGASFVIGGRDEERLRELAQELENAQGRPDVRVAAVDEPEKLDAMLDGVDVLINCVGPFEDLGKPVVRAAIRNGVHYLDTSGEQEHIRWVADNCHDDAERAGIVVMPSCAFEFALGDLAADIALANAASRIVIAYAVADMKMSRGTKKSIVRTLAGGGVTFVGGEHVHKRTGYSLFDVPFPDGSLKKGVWVPGGEAITVPRRGGVSRVETCLIASEGMAHFAAPLLGLIPSLVRVLQPLTDRVLEQTSGDPDADQAKGCTFFIITFDPKTSREYITLQGRDTYATTAEIASETACRLVTDTPARYGFVGPADLFDPSEFLEAIHITIVDSESDKGR